jgi:hypothetical protein
MCMCLAACMITSNRPLVSRAGHRFIVTAASEVKGGCGRVCVHLTTLVFECV